MPKKAYAILAAIIVVGVAIVIVTLQRPANQSAPSSPDTSQSDKNSRDNNGDAPSEVTKTGTFGCLAAKGDGPHTMECAFGLTQADGTTYALRANDPAVFADLPASDQKIEVSGTLTQERSTTYETLGTIEVSSVRKL